MSFPRWHVLFTARLLLITWRANIFGALLCTTNWACLYVSVFLNANRFTWNKFSLSPSNWWVMKQAYREHLRKDTQRPNQLTRRWLRVCTATGSLAGQPGQPRGSADLSPDAELFLVLFSLPDFVTVTVETCFRVLSFHLRHCFAWRSSPPGHTRDGLAWPDLGWSAAPVMPGAAQQRGPHPRKQVS